MNESKTVLEAIEEEGREKLDWLDARDLDSRLELAKNVFDKVNEQHNERIATSDTFIVLLS